MDTSPSPAPSPARRRRPPAHVNPFFIVPVARLPLPGLKLRHKLATPARLPTPASGRESRYLQPVPPPTPADLVPARRGRNARKRAHQAEHFRHYLWLRRQLKPWSDAFREKHGRTPTLVDVHRAAVPGLLDRFVEYLDALDQLRSFSNS